MFFFSRIFSHPPLKFTGVASIPITHECGGITSNVVSKLDRFSVFAHHRNVSNFFPILCRGWRPILERALWGTSGHVTDTPSGTRLPAVPLTSKNRKWGPPRSIWSLGRAPKAKLWPLITPWRNVTEQIWDGHLVGRDSFYVKVNLQHIRPVNSPAKWPEVKTTFSVPFSGPNFRSVGFWK